jgi:hypothetical protein
MPACPPGKCETKISSGQCLQTEGRRTLGRPRRRWEENIIMDLREVGWRARTGSIWLRIGAGGGLLCIR